MAFDVSGLSNYTDQSALNQIVTENLAPKTAKMANVVPKVKSAFDLHLLGVTPTAQVGGDCAFNASGTVAMTARTLTTSPVKYEDNLCLQALEAKYTQMMLQAGQDYSGSSIPEVIMTKLMSEIAEDLEVNDWQGTVAGAAKYNGLLVPLRAATITQANAAAYIPGGSTITSVDETNIYKVVYGLVRAMRATAPAVMAKNPVIALPEEWLGYLQEYYLSKNYFAAAGQVAGNSVGDDTMLPVLGFSNVKVFGTVGLSGTGEAWMMDFKKNAFLGVDADGEENNAKIWYSQDNLTHKYSIRFRRGWQIAYPSEVKKFTLYAS